MIFDYFFLFFLGLYSHYKSYETGIVGKMLAPFTDLLLLLIAMLIRDMIANSKHCPDLLSITGRIHIAFSAATGTKIFDGKSIQGGYEKWVFLVL